MLLMNIQSQDNLETRAWQTHNLACINKRLLIHKDNFELAKIIPSQIQGVFVRNHENILELYCYEPNSRQLSDIMSRIDLEAPLTLISPYTQVLFLSACWSTNPPRHIYMAGVGGGRMAMLFHHCFPELMIDGSDIDPAMLTVSRDYFGIEFDERYDIRACDSRADLCARHEKYDVILLDVFLGKGNHANHLATVEFFELCRSKMTGQGVLAANLIETDPLHQEKLAAARLCFGNVHLWEVNGAKLLLASNMAITKAELEHRAAVLENTFGFNHPFSSHLKDLNLYTAKQDITPLRDGVDGVAGAG